MDEFNKLVTIQNGKELIEILKKMDFSPYYNVDNGELEGIRYNLIPALDLKYNAEKDELKFNESDEINDKYFWILIVILFAFSGFKMIKNSNEEGLMKDKSLCQGANFSKQLNNKEIPPEPKLPIKIRREGIK